MVSQADDLQQDEADADVLLDLAAEYAAILAALEQLDVEDTGGWKALNDRREDVADRILKTAANVRAHDGDVAMLLKRYRDDNGLPTSL